MASEYRLLDAPCTSAWYPPRIVGNVSNRNLPEWVSPRMPTHKSEQIKRNGRSIAEQNVSRRCSMQRKDGLPSKVEYIE